MQYNITIGDKIININYINEGYEFRMTYNSLEYCGYSSLKNLNINKFQNYLDYCEQHSLIILNKIYNKYSIKLPIIFTDNYEIVIMALLNDTEEISKNLNEQNKKLNDITNQLSNLSTKIINLNKIIIDKDNQINELKLKSSEYKNIELSNEKIHFYGCFSVNETFMTMDGKRVFLNDLNMKYSYCFHENFIIDIIDKIQQNKKYRLINADFYIITQQYFENWRCDLYFIKASPLKIIHNPKININYNWINIGIEQMYEQGKTNNRTYKLYYK
jgi:hypothetical protein